MGLRPLTVKGTGAMKKDFDFKEHKQRVDLAVQSYGWLEVLRALTPLSNAISAYKSGQGKGGVTLAKSAHDVCPCCSGKGAGDQILHLHHNAELTGGAHCWRSGQNFDGYSLISEFNGWSFADTFREVKRVIGFSNTNNAPLPMKKVEPKVLEPTKKELEYARRLQERMQSVWDGTLSFSHFSAAPAQQYLSGRGLPFRGQNYNEQVRFHPGLEYFISIPDRYENEKPEHKQYREGLTQYALNHRFYVSHTKHKSGLPRSVNMGKHPCIVLMMRNGKDGKPKRLHRIYLSQDGKKIEFHGKFDLSAKMMMQGSYGAEIQEASVHLAPAGCPIIGLAEGFETAEACIQATDMPMHVTISASGIGGYYPTKGTKFIFVFEDKDRSKTGENQSKKLIERLAVERPEIRVIRLVPPADIPEGEKTIDWLDIFAKYGESAFPDIAKNWHLLL